MPSKSKVSTDLSLCEWTRAHFADTEGLLLGVSTVNTHHSAVESKQNRLKHQAAVGDYNTDRPRVVLNSVSESVFYLSQLRVATYCPRGSQVTPCT